MTSTTSTRTTMTTPDPIATVHGYPRQGRNRELKRATERFWRGAIDADELDRTVADLRSDRLQTLASAGIGELPVGDFSVYDHVLDTAVLLGALPPRVTEVFPKASDTATRFDRYFAASRGTDRVDPLEMTKWFDTNYHYLVPELSPDTEFRLDAGELLQQVREAQAMGLPVRPVIVGPFTFLRLSKSAVGSRPGLRPTELLRLLVPHYQELLEMLADAGVGWVQFDEPCTVTDLDADDLAALGEAYARLSGSERRPRVLVGSYFGTMGGALGALLQSGVDGLAVDLVGAAQANLDTLLGQERRAGIRLIAGVVDGRNVWRADLDAALWSLRRLADAGYQVDVAPSCSLLHVPIDVAQETDLDAAVVPWLAFADQKLGEVSVLARGLAEGDEAIKTELAVARSALESRRTSALAHRSEIRSRSGSVTADDLHRRSPYSHRAITQHAVLNLPLLPTTTIGSFPQTDAIRAARADLRAGRLDQAGYEQQMRAQIAEVVELQDQLGLDVLVHGEPERNDMVQYFADQLDGFVSTAHGWVQSYGSRYVRPPIVVGDVSRSAPLTVSWASWAASLSQRPMKGMLTGPVTILAWSFVRDDQPVADTARQVALAIRDEVTDLEAAGLPIVQVDEPALRELLPLRAAERPAYLSWAVDAFRLATAVASDATQIHTHMCYAEFDDIAEAIEAMDADVISLEASRSRMEIVSGLSQTGYAREIGPGVWDVHSPRIPAVEEMVDRLRLACANFPDERIWVNPDCGLKTRAYAEVRPALAHLVQAAQRVRAELQVPIR